MNLRDLKYLVALDEHRHFTKAADRCFVSQPTLSMQIKKLEEQLGVQLLERNNKSVTLTTVGLAIAQQAREILHQVDNIYETAKIAKDPFSGEINIGIIPTLAPYLLPHIIPGLKKAFPKLKYYLIEEQTHKLIDKLKFGKLDAVILALPVLENTFTISPLFIEEFLLLVPADHSLAKRKRVQSADLKNDTLLLLEEGHCLREQALELCHFLQPEAKNFSATSLETLRHMVASGIGITLIPKLACKPSPGISYIPFHNPKPSRSIGLVWRASTAKVNLFKEIADKIKKLMEKVKD